MTLLEFWRYLLAGSDDLYLSSAWLENTSRLGNYVGYTRRQLEQGAVISDVAAMRRKQFWEAQDAKRKSSPSKVTSIKRIS